MAFDSIEGKVLMFGGSSGDTGMWAFESGWNDSPGQIFTSYVYYYQQPDIFQYSKVYFRSISGFFNAGGVGDVQGSAINGVDLIAWKNGSWETVSSNDAGVDDLKSVLGIFSNDHEEIKSILNGNSSNIYIAAIPKAPRGFGTVEGQIASDYMEMILSYTILEPDDFAPTGHLDGAGADFMWGWACDKDTPEENIHVVLSFYTGETYLTSIDIGETNNPSEQGVQDICGEGSTTHRFSFNPSTSAELQQALHDKFISRPVTLTVHAYGMNTGPVPPGSNTELGDSPKEFVY